MLKLLPVFCMDLFFGLCVLWLNRFGWVVGFFEIILVHWGLFWFWCCWGFLSVF